MLGEIPVWSRENIERWRLKLLRRDQVLKLLAICILIATIVFLVTYYVPYGVDWRTAFRPAAQALLHLESPYSVEGYFNAPWALLPLIPIALLPESLGYALLVLFSLAGFSYTAHRIGARPSVIVILLLSPPVIHSLLNGNIDALAVLGFVMPPQIGLFFILIKPQIGIALAIYWLIESWREGGVHLTFKTFAPVTGLLIISFLLFGLWPLRFKDEIHLWWNASLWPASIPIGLGLLAAALRGKKKEYAIAASPFLSPYVLLHSWVGALLAMVSRVRWITLAVMFIWALIIIRSF
jgi:hypothetical protein